MLLIVKLRGGSILLKAPKAAIIVGIVQTAGNFGLGAIAVKFGEAGKSAVLTYTMPFWAVLLAWLLLRDKPTPRHWLGLALAAIGLLCIIEPWRPMGSIMSTTTSIPLRRSTVFGRRQISRSNGRCS